MALNKLESAAAEFAMEQPIFREFAGLVAVHRCSEELSTLAAGPMATRSEAGCAVEVELVDGSAAGVEREFAAAMCAKSETAN